MMNLHHTASPATFTDGYSADNGWDPYGITSAFGQLQIKGKEIGDHLHQAHEMLQELSRQPQSSSYIPR